MKKLVVCLLAVVLSLSLSFQAKAEEVKSLEDYFFRIQALEGNITQEEAFEFAGVILTADQAEAFHFVKVVIKSEASATGTSFCGVVNNYGWILQVIHDVITGKVIPYQSCTWYLYTFIAETLVWCPSTCLCASPPGFWCLYHQFNRVNSLVALKSCQN